MVVLRDFFLRKFDRYRYLIKRVKLNSKQNDEFFIQHYDSSCVYGRNLGLYSPRGVLEIIMDTPN